jgi:hypothetical protein
MDHDMTKRRINAASRLVGALIAAAAFCAAPVKADVQYAQLKQRSIKLPYNLRVAITGSTSEVKFGTRDLTTILSPEAVGAQYTVNGQQTTVSPQAISGNQWTVTVGPFVPEAQSVDLRFLFTGKLVPAEVERIVSDMLSSADFSTAFNSLLAATVGNAPDVQIAAVDIFTNTFADLFRKRLPAGLTVDLETLRTAVRRLYPVLNISDSLAAWGRAAVGFLPAGTDPGKTLADAVKIAQAWDDTRIDGALQEPFRQQLKTARDRLVGDWKRLASALQLQVVAGVDVTASVIEAALIQDLQKYAGFDAGALYVPRLHELRGFFTVNIYPFGPVNLTPEGSIKSRDRWSLTFGISTGDISGGASDKSKIHGDNAFVYGVGYRINKYFRFTAGGLLYRTGLIDGVTGNLTNKLRHEFMIGPSIDITALPGLKSIFAAGTGTSK